MEGLCSEPSDSMPNAFHNLCCPGRRALEAIRALATCQARSNFFTNISKAVLQHLHFTEEDTEAT
jgi:hypothetical protein